MKAVGYRKAGPVTAPGALEDVTLQVEKPRGRDILVAVRAVSVNPVDTKVRRGVEPEGGTFKVLGWDAAGVVEDVGPDASLFKRGDAVFYAGSLARAGTNSEYHLVDERIVGHKPVSLGFAEAASLPLTSITAWEALFDRLDVRKPVVGASDAILIVGGAGGVGSIAIQILKVLTGLTIIVSASREETRDWVRNMGAHHVVDHSKNLAEEVAALGTGMPGFVFSTTQSDKHFDAIADLLCPQGRVCMIDDPGLIDVRKLKRKSLSLHWELMFTRPLYETTDIIRQHELLNEISKLSDGGKIKPTMAEHFGTINAANLLRAHAKIESGTARGKIVLEGF